MDLSHEAPPHLKQRQKSFFSGASKSWLMVPPPPLSAILIIFILILVRCQRARPNAAPQNLAFTPPVCVSYGWLEGVGFPCLSGLGCVSQHFDLCPTYDPIHGLLCNHIVQHPAPSIRRLASCSADGPKAYLEASRPASDGISRVRPSSPQCSLPLALSLV